MARLATLATLGMAAFLAAIPGHSAGAAEIAVPADETSLQTIVDAATPGDVLLLKTGRHRGPVSITKRVTLQGETGAIVRGDGQGSVITIEAANSAVRGLEIVGSGSNLDTMDAGVFVKETAKGALVEGNAILGNLYGIYLHGAAGAVARGNRIEGMHGGRTNQAGNGVSVWNAPGAKVVGNQISFGRDGIFAAASKHNEFSANTFHDVRFAIHYMYTNDSVVALYLKMRLLA